MLDVFRLMEEDGRQHEPLGGKMKNDEFEEHRKMLLKFFYEFNWKASLVSALKMEKIAKARNDKERTAYAGVYIGWIKKFMGDRASGEEEKKKLYEEAEQKWRLALSESGDLKVRILAVRGLMLVKVGSAPELFAQGCRDIERSDCHPELGKNLRAELEFAMACAVEPGDRELSREISRRIFQTVSPSARISEPWKFGKHLLKPVGQGI